MEFERLKMHVKAVLFDLGGTLIRTAPIPEIYKRVLKRFGVEASSEQILETHRMQEQQFDVTEGQLELGEDFWIQWNLKVLEGAGISENREFLARRIDELWWEHADLELYADVVPTLKELDTRGIQLGIVTNGLKKDFEQILERLNLTNFFEVAVGIDSCNKAKPSKEIFLYALDKMGVRPEEALFIGDSIRYDYNGAEEAGLKAYVIDREGTISGHLNKIHRLTELLSLI